MADDTRKVRVEERLKIKIGEAKNLPPRSHGAPCRDTYCVLSLDQEEIFRTSTMERTLDPFFAEEFQFEVPRRFRYLSIYVYDRDKNQDKVLGKVAIKQEDLQKYNKDHWFTLRPVDADSEVQGKVHIDLSLEDSRRRLRMEPKPPDPDPSADVSSKGKANNLSRLCKGFGTCSSSTSRKLLSSALTEPALSRSESLKEAAAWAARTKPPMHSLGSADASPSPSAADYWSDPERHCAARDGPDLLRLRVLECNELTTKNGQCDPFAVITLHYSNGHRVERRTKPRKKTVNPQFDEIFCFDVICEPDPKDKDASQSCGVASEARISIWHDAQTPVFLGEVRLQLRHPAPKPQRAWYLLSSRSGGAFCRGATPPGTPLSAAGGAVLGSLRLQLQYTVDHVFPLQHYARLERLLLDSGSRQPIKASAVYILGEIVSNKTEAAQPLVRLFMHHDIIVPIVRGLADAEISALTDATTIFRGNTLVSKMMDEAMRLSGASYLRSVLRPTLAAVLAEKRPCEIDPAKVKPSSAVAGNLANLRDYVERVFSAITQSYATCPPTMCRLFDALRECATRHFPQNAEIRYSVISGFIFLRFFAPAILGPRLFDLTTEQIDPQTNRTLTLISKTIQSLGNLVSSRSAQQVCKEEYMAALYSSFRTTRHVQEIKHFLEMISTSSDAQNSNVQETQVLLKEGTMIKRSETVRDNGTSPRRRWARGAHTNAKRRHFRLTSTELSWSRVGRASGTHRLSLSDVIDVSPVECPAAGAPLGHNNMFQIVHRDRVVQIQANNCVERAEWMRLLDAVRAPHYAHARCDRCAREQSAVCRCRATLSFRLDPARDLQRLHALLVQHAERLERSVPAPGWIDADMSENERAAMAETLRELKETVFDLECSHRTYRRSKARETKYGSKQTPIGDDNYLQVTGGAESAGRSWRRDEEMTSSCESLRRLQAPPRPPRCAEYELMADFRSAPVGSHNITNAPPAIPPRPALSRADPLRASNPPAAAASRTSLRTSSSTSDVADAAAGRALVDRIAPFFKRKPKSTDESTSKRKEDSKLIGRLTPRFSRGQSLELARSSSGRPVESPVLDSSMLESLQLLNLHRYGADAADDWRPPLLPPPTDIRL